MTKKLLLTFKSQEIQDILQFFKHKVDYFITGCRKSCWTYDALFVFCLYLDKLLEESKLKNF